MFDTFGYFGPVAWVLTLVVIGYFVWSMRRRP